MAYERHLITGKMKGTWISKIAKHPAVTRHVDDIGMATKRKLHANIRASSPSGQAYAKRIKGFRSHIGESTKMGPWGRTWVLWAASPMAKKRAVQSMAIVRAVPELSEKSEKFVRERAEARAARKAAAAAKRRATRAQKAVEKEMLADAAFYGGRSSGGKKSRWRFRPKFKR